MLRRNKYFTIKELAEHFGIGRNAMAKLCRGVNMADPDAVIEFLVHFAAQNAQMVEKSEVVEINMN
jgi:hypothetical protein